MGAEVHVGMFCWLKPRRQRALNFNSQLIYLMLIVKDLKRIGCPRLFAGRVVEMLRYWQLGGAPYLGECTREAEGVAGRVKKHDAS